MGTWGSSLFEDDLAADIQVSFESAVERGQSPEKAAQEVLQAYSEVLDDADEGPVVYLSLASLLTDSGVSEHGAISRALKIIGNDEGLERWSEAGEDALRARRAVYDQLRKRIGSNQGSGSAKSKHTRVKLPKVGDYLQIPLSDGRYAYGQYVFWHESEGPLLQIFDLIAISPVAVNDLVGTKPLFPPIVTYLNHAVRTGRWQIIGSSPISRFAYPGFISGNPDKSGVIREWWYFDGKNEQRIGPKLPERLKGLEFQMLWSLESVEERIRTGHDPYIDRLKKANHLD